MPCCCHCPGPRASTTATRSAWATTSGSTTAMPCARRCSGPPTATRASPRQTPASSTSRSSSRSSTTTTTSTSRRRWRVDPPDCTGCAACSRCDGSTPCSASATSRSASPPTSGCCPTCGSTGAIATPRTVPPWRCSASTTSPPARSRPPSPFPRSCGTGRPGTCSAAAASPTSAPTAPSPSPSVRATSSGSRSHPVAVKPVAEIHTAASLSPSKIELVEGWMGEQRWYAAKGQQPRLRRLFSWRLDDPEGEVGVETLILADEAGAEPVVYQVPLTYRGEPLGSADHALVGTMEHSVLGRRWVYDGPHDPVYAAQLLELVQGRVRAASSKVSGAVEESVAGVPQPSWSTEVHVRTSRVLSGEQSNTSVILDGDLPDGHHTPLIVKVFRMLSPGENPDVVLQGALVDAGSRRVPAVAGSVTAHWPHPGTEGDQPASGHLAFAQEFLAGVEDAWRVALHAAEAGTDFAEPARALGEATAEVHGTLADALGTEPTSHEQAVTIVDEMRARFEAAVAEAPELEDVRGPVDAVLRAAADAHWPPLQRIHGDYHLGQVLHSSERGWVLLDFEGEPLRPLSERSMPDQWVRDVAGMLRSFDYVGGTREQADGSSARDWVASAQQAFLDGYAARAGEDPRSLGALLAAFELDKAMYEVVYEARNRPGWVAIPLGAVRRLTAHFSPSSKRTHDLLGQHLEPGGLRLRVLKPLARSVRVRFEDGE